MQLARIYDPTSHGATELGFRHFGPLRRFDHHDLVADERPRDDEQRGIWYGSFGELAIRCCAVEVFGPEREIELATRRLALPTVASDIRLLDLRGEAALEAGVTAELAKWPDPRLTWAWARFFHTLEVGESPLDGLLYGSAWNDLPCVALYERARGKLHCSDPCRYPLSEPGVRDELLRVAEQYGFSIA